MGIRVLFLTASLLALVGAWTAHAQPVATLTANGETESLSIPEEQSVVLGASLAPGSDAGQAVDWWLVKLTPGNEWAYYLHPTGWIHVGPDWSRMEPGYQGPMVELRGLTLPGPLFLPRGAHNFYFGVDLLLNRRLDMSAVYYDGVNVNVASGSSTRLGHSDLTYEGAFRLPDEFSWGARGLSFRPGGDGGQGSLLVTGFQGLMTNDGEACYEGLEGCAAYFGEVAIPAPVTAASWEGLPVADLLRPPTIFDGGQVAGIEEAYTFVSGIEYVPRQGSQTSDKLYGSLNVWYPEGVFGDATFPSIWFSELDGSNARGVFHVGPTSDPLYHGRKMGEYLFSVPQWYADTYLGGRTLVTGRSRGTPLSDVGENRSAGGSQGPTLFAFRPWDTESPSGPLDAIAMLYYRVLYPECAGPDIGVGGQPVTCDYPGFSMCDEWSGGSFIESGSRRAIVLLGQKGCTNCYYCDETTDDPECTVTPLPGECDRYCNEGRGFHCGPYKRYVIFYDADELGRAAAGSVVPWTILPYEIWEPNEFLLKPLDGNVCGDAGGMTFDSTGGRLFMVERGFGGYENENAAVVHVWSLGTGG